MVGILEADLIAASSFQFLYRYIHPGRIQTLRGPHSPRPYLLLSVAPQGQECLPQEEMRVFSVLDLP